MSRSARHIDIEMDIWQGMYVYRENSEKREKSKREFFGEMSAGWSQNPWNMVDEFSETRYSSNTNRSTQNNSTEEGKTTDGETSSSVRASFFDSTTLHRTKHAHTQKKPFVQKEATMFLVDCRENMLRTNDEGETYLNVALEAIRDTLKSNVFRCTSKVHGILFLGAKNEKNEHQFHGIHKLHDLQQPGSRFIKDIEVLMDEDIMIESEEEEEMDQDLASTQKISLGKIFRDKVGCLSEDSHLPLHDALWMTALEMSKARLKKEDIREIQIFTNDDDPFKQDQAKSQQTEDKARTMIQDENYDIYIFCMKRSRDHSFDLNRFYRRIVPADPHDPHVIRAGAGSFRDFIDDIRRKEFKKRANARVPFRVGNPRDAQNVFEFGVEVFNCVQFITKPSATKLEASNNKPTLVRTRWIDASTGASLLPHEIKTYHFYGKRRVYLSKSETQELKQFGIDRHFRLLGFADKSSLRPELSLKSPYFLRPDEFDYPGSGKFFTALHRRMTRRSKIVYVSFVPTGASVPRVYAMIPQLEVVDEETGGIVNAAGFNLIAMPYVHFF